MEAAMRTTVDIEDDVLTAVKEIARRRGTTISNVLSDFARLALVQPQEVATRNGVPLFPVRLGAGIVTPERVRQLHGDGA
jgi:hypothetical protein